MDFTPSTPKLYGVRIFTKWYYVTTLPFSRDNRFMFKYSIYYVLQQKFNLIRGMLVKKLLLN